jgi:hypothetical protein
MSLAAVWAKPATESPYRRSTSICTAGVVESTSAASPDAGEAATDTAGTIEFGRC